MPSPNQGLLRGRPTRLGVRPAQVLHSRRTHQETRCARARADQIVLQGTTRGELVEQLAREALQRAAALPPGKQHLVAIAGGPGSGKTTTAACTAARINALAAERGLPGGAAGSYAVVVPMDGFHFYRHQLDAMPNPEEAHGRRGAHWTFDAAAFVAVVRRIREQGGAAVPSFDHVVGDPVEGDIRVTPDNRVVLLEGNYLLLPDDPWRQLRDLVDDTWFVDADLDTAMARVFDRQTREVGLAKEVSRRRIAGNDRPNAEQVAATRGAARVVIPNGGGGAAAKAA